MNQNVYHIVLSGIFTQIQYTISLSQANSIHTQSQIGISTQNGISNSGANFTCNTCIWYIQDLYISKYKYTIIIIIT